jgi:hypothetical protein
MPNAARAHLCNHQGELGKHESDNPNPRFLTHGANTYGFKFLHNRFCMLNFGYRRKLICSVCSTQLALEIGDLP